MLRAAAVPPAAILYLSLYLYSGAPAVGGGAAPRGRGPLRAARLRAQGRRAGRRRRRGRTCGRCSLKRLLPSLGLLRAALRRRGCWQGHHGPAAVAIIPLKKKKGRKKKKEREAQRRAPSPRAADGLPGTFGSHPPQPIPGGLVPSVRLAPPPGGGTGGGSQHPAPRYPAAAQRARVLCSAPPRPGPAAAPALSPRRAAGSRRTRPAPQRRRPAARCPALRQCGPALVPIGTLVRERT